MTELGKILLLFGVVFVALGLLVLAAGKLPWLGRLPGDITIRWPGGLFYFPLATCLLLSILVSILFSIFRR